jgi:hypothetical protein
MPADSTPWVVAAGQLLAKAHAELDSPDALTRVSAESWLGVAKAELKRSTETVSFLKACLALEIA